MALCEGCQREIDAMDREPVRSRGPLMVGWAPPAVTWRGTVLPVTTAQARLLYLLCRTGDLTFMQIETLMSVETARVQIHRMRQILTVAGAADLIQPIYGWGYRLNPLYFREEAADGLD